MGVRVCILTDNNSDYNLRVTIPPIDAARYVGNKRKNCALHTST